MARIRVAIVQHGPDGPWELLELVDADIVVLPENWLSREPVALEEYVRESLRIASRLGAPLLAGTQYVRVPEGVKSVGVLALPEGSYRMACEKMFPSASIGERGVLSSGRPGGVLEVAGVRVACISCVDIFYPEIARYHALRGADLLVNPASIPWNRVYTWRSILSSRAAENIVFTIGANKTGTPYPDGRVTGGHSAAYAPDGEALACLGPHPSVVHVEVNTEYRSLVGDRRRFLEDARYMERSGLYNWKSLGWEGL